MVMGYGLPPTERDVSGLLRERYGVEFRTVGFCTVSRTTREYADGYNAVSEPGAMRQVRARCF
jgi:hypothetical protein